MGFKINIFSKNTSNPSDTTIDLNDISHRDKSSSADIDSVESDDIKYPEVPVTSSTIGLSSNSNDNKSEPTDTTLQSGNSNDYFMNNKIFKEDRDHTIFEIYFNRYILVLVLSLLTSILVYRFVMPFLPFMVLTFYPNDDKTELGYKTGWLTTSLNIGGFLGSILWGYIADWYGRRRAMIYSLLFTTIAVILFGFSSNFIYSIFIRVLWGLVNGGSGVTKTMMAEVCNSHDAPIALSFLGTSDSIGNIIGQYAGGYIGDRKNYESIANSASIFHKFPYLFPLLICACISLLGLIIAASSIKETLPVQRQRENRANIFKRNRTSTGNDSLLSIIAKKEVFFTVFLYCIAGIHGGGVDEIFPLYLLNTQENGGFNYSSADIGLLNVFVAIIQLFSMLFVYPYFISYFGLIHSGVVNASVVILFTICFPSLSYLNTVDKSWSFVFLTPYLAFIQISRVMLFITILSIINNSCLPTERSRVNGVSQTFSAIGRSIGPILFSSVFAYFLNSSISKPFNIWITFFILVIPHSFIIIILLWLPKSLNKKKTDIVNTSDNNVKDSSDDITNNINDENNKNADINFTSLGINNSDGSCTIIEVSDDVIQHPAETN